MLDVGWPEPAEVLHRIESTLSCWASSRMSSMVFIALSWLKSTRLTVHSVARSILVPGGVSGLRSGRHRREGFRLSRSSPFEVEDRVEDIGDLAQPAHRASCAYSATEYAVTSAAPMPCDASVMTATFDAIPTINPFLLIRC